MAVIYYLLNKFKYTTFTISLEKPAKGFSNVSMTKNIVAPLSRSKFPVKFLCYDFLFFFNYFYQNIIFCLSIWKIMEDVSFSNGSQHLENHERCFFKR